MDTLTQSDDLDYSTQIRELFAEYFGQAKNKKTMRDTFIKAGWPAKAFYEIRFTRDNAAAIMYADKEPCALITVDYSEPCIKITYVKA